MFENIVHHSLVKHTVTQRRLTRVDKSLVKTHMESHRVTKIKEIGEYGGVL